MSAARTRRAEKLAHYARKHLNTFVQLDGFNPPTWPVGRGTEDADGDEQFVGITEELMNGATVRVLVDPKADPAVVARLLKKLTVWWERDGADLRAEALEAVAEEPELGPAQVYVFGSLADEQIEEPF